MTHSPDAEAAFDTVVADYPESYGWLWKNNRTRLLWQISMVERHVPAGGRVLDLGAGIVPFMPVCRKLGYETVIVDDFEDEMYKSTDTDRVLALSDRLGVERLTGDALMNETTALGDGPLDMVTSHDSMEHWHNSPKPVFHALWAALRAGGLFYIGVPNCVNLRKRITVPLGYGKWSQMRDWYEPEVFRGHVREPDTDDLRYIARDLGAARTEVIGRNWVGYRHPSKLVRAITPLIDRPMRPFPALCSDIYLLAWK